MPVSFDLVSPWLILGAAPRLLKPIWQGIKHLSSSCRTLLPLGLARSSSLPFVLLVYQLGPPLCLKLCFQLSPPSALPIPASASLVSSCRWEVGDVSTSNIGETVVSYQTMKYKFNYTPLVKFLNFIVWYDTMKTSTLERQSISICSRQGHALIPPPSRVIFVSCQGEKEQLPTCSIIALSPSVTRLWSGSSLLLMPIVVGALWTPFGIIESVSSTRLIRIQFIVVTTTFTIYQEAILAVMAVPQLPATAAV